MGGGLQKKHFSALRASVWSKNKVGGGGAGPSPGSAAVYPRYCRISCFRKVSNISLDHSYLFGIFGILVIIPLFTFSNPEEHTHAGKKIFSSFNIVRQIIGCPVIPSS